MNKLVTVIRESRTARFLIPLGIILIVFGIIIFVISYQSRDFARTEATVTAAQLEEEAHTDSDGHRVEATYNVSIKYTVDGKDYEAELSGLPEYKAGDKMSIYYNPSDPGQITQSKSLIIPLVMIVAGIAAFAGGVFSGVNAVKRYKKMRAQEEEWANGN